jgi:transcriptional antiterminator RfaH
LKIFAERSLHTAEVAGYIGAIMSYWACAQLEANRERLALHCLGLAGYETYLPRILVKRVTPARKTSVQAPALFPGYAFVLIELQWHAARWSPGILRLVLDNDRPDKVPDNVIAELKGRERNGLVELPSSPGFRRGDKVRIVRGPLAGLEGLVEGLRPQQRIEILLAVLGRVGLARADVEVVG